MADPETTALVATAASSLPPGVKANLLTSIGSLLTAVVDVPVAWLEGKAKILRATAAAEAGVISAVGQKNAEVIPADLDVLQRSKENFLNRLVRSQRNREAISEKVVAELGESPPTEDTTQPIDPDWLDMYSRVSETKSNEDMQTLFARLLAGEIRRPGTFSPATVEVLSRLSSDTARHFRDLCSLSSTLHLSTREAVEVAPPRVISAPYGSPGTNGLSPVGFTFTGLCELQDAGLVQGQLELTWSVPALAFPHVVIVCGGEPIRFRWSEQPVSHSADKMVKIKVISFTRSGCELFRLVDLQPHAEYIAKLRDWLDNALKPIGVSVCPAE